MKLLYDIINNLREDAGKATVANLTGGEDLRKDLGFDSLELAILTVRIEAAFGVDVFEDGVVRTVGDVLAKINGKKTK